LSADEEGDEDDYEEVEDGDEDEEQPKKMEDDIEFGNDLLDDSTSSADANQIIGGIEPIDEEQEDDDDDDDGLMITI
jgi:hypothetical protein